LIEREVRGRPGRLPILATSLLLVAPFLLYGGSLGGWWAGDDPQVLKLAIRHRPDQILFVPSVWRELSWLYFVPMLPLSFDVDLRLFGLRPSLFHVHQLLALGAVAALLAAVLARWVSRRIAVVAGLLFFFGPMLPALARDLWSRQYVEGLALSLGATLCFVRSVEEGGRRWIAAATAFALAAMLCKEVFSPLVFLLLVLPVGRAAVRWRRAAPLLAALGVYAVWRQLMLGGYIGGYTEDSARLATMPLRAPLLLRKVGNGLIGAGGGSENTASLVAVLMAAALLVGLLSLRRAALFFVLFLAVLVLGPLLPVAEALQPRYLLVPWTALVAVLALAGDAGLSRGRPVIVASMALLLLVAVHFVASSRRIWAAGVSSARQSEAEGRFFLDQSGPGDVLRTPVDSGWYYEGLAWLKENVLGLGRAGTVVYDDVAFCSGAHARRVFMYQPESGRVADVSVNLARLAAPTCGRVRTDVPLTARLSYSDSVVHWSLGPFTSGRWALLSGGVLAPFEVPREGSLRLPLSSDAGFRVRYEATEGWLAYSPPLTLHVTNGFGALDWKR
jgi:hypothetical protein